MGCERKEHTPKLRGNGLGDFADGFVLMALFVVERLYLYIYICIYIYGRLRVVKS